MNHNSKYQRPIPIQSKKAQPPQKKAKADPIVNVVPERIQKVLARGGVGSRREIERWIEEGRFTVNGKPISLGYALKAGDYLELNGRVIHWEKYTQQPTRVLIYNKPVGEVVTRHDPENRPIVFNKLPKLAVGRWIAVGRLDINTSGLLLVTNNGELANRLMHPSTQIDREYAVRILGEVPDETLANLRNGIELEDGVAKFDDIQFYSGEGANKWYHVVVSEGRNRLVRRMWESQNLVVSRLMRVRYGPILLPTNVRAGDVFELNHHELSVLMKFAGMSPEKADLSHEFQAEKVKSAPKAKSDFKSGGKEKPAKSDWTYKNDAQAQEQAVTKKPSHKGNSASRKNPRFKK